MLITVVYFLCAIINTLIYKSLLSLETSEKELTTALERLSIANEITTINNENNVNSNAECFCCHRFHKT